MECNFAKNGLRIVRGNAFTLRIVVKAYRVDGSEVSGFVLDPTRDVLLLTTNTGVRAIPFTVEDGSTNHALVEFGGGLQVGYYGLDFSGVFSGEDWRFAAKNVFQIVELTNQGNVPKDGIVYEDTYDVAAGVSLSLLGPQADWAENDPTKQSYIKNKPVIYTKAEIDVLLAAEVQARQQADGVLDGKIADEVTRAKAAEKANADAIADEIVRAKAAEKANADDIDVIEGKIPSGASSSNQLVDNQTMTNGLAQKQDTINDLQTIREGAAAGALSAPQATTYTKTEVDGLIGNEETRAKAAEKANADDIDAIEAKIPAAASSSNQLADKQFVNSSIATNTATYRGSFNLVSDLSLTVAATEQQIAAALATKMTALSITPDNNDYCFVQIPTADATPTEISRIDRYKYNGTAWLYEYSLNNSSFTAAQWAAINSGITSNLVTKLGDLPTATELANALLAKQDVISDLQAIREGAAAGALAAPQATTYTKTEVDNLLAAKENTSNKVVSIDGNSTDTQYPSAKAVYDFVRREAVEVNATANSGSVTESAVLKIMVGSEVVAQGTGLVQAYIPYGTQYSVEAERVNDYLTPASQTFTAGIPMREVTMEYTYIERDTITIDQTETDELSMISGDVQGDVIKAIRAASHLYLGKQTEAGNQLICQLKDDDGTKYADGSTAAMDGSEGDQWLKLPVFWWKVTPIGTAAEDGSYDQYSFSFAFSGQPDSTWKKWEGDKNLLGAKKMYVTGGKGYSRSGIQGSANFTQATGNNYASARGTGYSCVTWEWQWMMCVLFYAWYGRMNAQAQCGSGSNSNTRTLGTKDSLGMTDTTSSNGNSDNTKFWGIENWWGDLVEWIGNITSQDYVVTIVDMNTKQSRQVSGWYQFGGMGGYASRFKVTEDLDFIPRAKNGTETTCYCDWVNGNSGARVVSRSFNGANPIGGVAFVYSNNEPSVAYANIGSRLAFNGVVTEAESVAAYKAALPQ